jgi:mono/diheme cytochrome c family protein
MSWRPSHNPRFDGRSSGSARAEQTGSSLFGFSPLLIIIAVGAVVLIGAVFVLVLNAAPAGNNGSAQPAAAVAPTATPAPVPTATPEPTVAAESAAEPVSTIDAADAGPADTSGDPSVGEQLFSSLPSESIALGGVSCVICHNTAPGSGTLVGPSLDRIGSQAATRVDGLTAAQYLRTSITQPDGYVVADFPAGIMTQTFADALTSEQIEDLVAYLLTLE